MNELSNNWFDTKVGQSVLLCLFMLGKYVYGFGLDYPGGGVTDQSSAPQHTLHELASN